MSAVAWWYENGIWKQGAAEDVLGGRVISVVGGGGKTSLMYYLAGVYQRAGKRTAVLTSTRIFDPGDACRTVEDCRRRWRLGQYAVCGEKAERGKLVIPNRELLSALDTCADVMLIEADGAKCKPCKAPAPHEPVLLEQSETVIGVMGLDALDRPVGEMCFRVEQVCELLGCDERHILTEDDMAAILLSPRGTRKDVGARRYDVVLNKCDDPERLERGKSIAQKLRALGQERTVLTKLK